MSSLPGAILWPGLNWAGQGGWSSCAMDVWHYTVGRDSRALCAERGLVQHLTRDEGTYQFVADVEMVCWTQCEWNGVATALEVESLDGSVTDAQLALMAYREQWVLATLGIPPVYYDAVADGGGRLPIGTDYRGVTTHRSLVHRACDMHSDGFDRWVWDAVTAPAPVPEPEEDDVAAIWWMPDRGAFLVSGGLILRRFTGPSGAYGICQQALDWRAPEARHAVRFVLADEREFLVLDETAAKQGI